MFDVKSPNLFKIHVTYLDVNKLMNEHEMLGKTAVLVSVNGVLSCMMAIADEVKPEAQERFNYQPLHGFI